MQKEFWIKRWESRETGWHQSEVEPALIHWAARRNPGRILVPLCGKSLDLVWLREHGYEVVGVELSTTACEEFFSEQKMSFKKTKLDEFTVYESLGITIFNGDFFKTTSEQLGLFDAVYDRAALIALPFEMRSLYTKHLIELLENSISKMDFDFLQIILERTPHDEVGPPFSVTLSELETLYGKHFVTHLCSKESVDAKAPAGSQTNESVLQLKPR